MITKALFLFTALFIQEIVVLNTLFLAVHRGVYPALLIFILFVIATVIDIIIGFYVGRYLRKKTSQTKVGRYIKKQSERFLIPEKGPQRWLLLLVLGNVNFCYTNAAVAAYLELPFWESQAYNFFGNILSYILLWYAVASIGSVFKNPYTAGGMVIALTLVIIIVLRQMRVRRL